MLGRLNCVTLKFICWSPSPNVATFGSEPLELIRFACTGRVRWPCWMSSLPLPGENTEKAATLQSIRGAFQNLDHLSVPDFELLDSRLWENNFLLFRPLTPSMVFCYCSPSWIKTVLSYYLVIKGLKKSLFTNLTKSVIYHCLNIFDLFI